MAPPNTSKINLGARSAKRLWYYKKYYSSIERSFLKIQKYTKSKQQNASKGCFIWHWVSETFRRPKGTLLERFKGLKGRFWTVHGAPWRPRDVHKTSPRRRQDVPKTPQLVSKTLRWRLETLPGRFHMAPRRPKDELMLPGRPRTLPRCPEE